MKTAAKTIIFILSCLFISTIAAATATVYDIAILAVIVAGWIWVYEKFVGPKLSS